MCSFAFLLKVLYISAHFSLCTHIYCKSSESVKVEAEHMDNGNTEKTEGTILSDTFLSYILHFDYINIVPHFVHFLLYPP